jgi:hypothetical protein
LAGGLLGVAALFGGREVAAEKVVAKEVAAEEIAAEGKVAEDADVWEAGGSRRGGSGSLRGRCAEVAHDALLSVGSELSGKGLIRLRGQLVIVVTLRPVQS